MPLLKLFKKYVDIDQDTYEFFMSKLSIKAFSKGSFIIKQGQIQKQFYFVNSGIQMAYLESGDKMHIINFTYSPFPCALPESFMLQKPATCYLKCLTDSELSCISYPALQQVFDQSPIIERLFRKMTEHLLAGVLNRYIELHSLTMEQQFRAFTKRSPQLLALIPHKYIASYLGIDPTNFSKLYNSIKI